MTGKFTRYLRVNRLTISRGRDGVWRVRSPDHPHLVLHEAPTQDEVYR